MGPEEEFDSFYRATRSDVLLLAFLLTGDLTAATSAVRDAYAIAWQRWRKVSRRDDPLDYVRPLSWRLAARRHTGRIWRRQKGLSPEQVGILDAVHQLSAGVRRVVLLVEVGGLELRHAARELALTPETAQTRLTEAHAALAWDLDVPTAEIGATLRRLTEPLGAARLPRPSIVLRAGSQRRRLHAVGAVVIAVALTVGTGLAARQPGLDRAAATHLVLPGEVPTGRPAASRASAPELATPEVLLQSYDLVALSPTRVWQVDRTDNNTGGDGINTICQQTRFADPRGLSSLVRTFRAIGRPAQRLLQSVEVSRTAAAARRAYRTTMGWFAECAEARVQLMGAFRISGVGDQAGLLQVRRWVEPATTYSVAVARVDKVTTTAVSSSAGRRLPHPKALAKTLALAVAKLCPEDGPVCTGPAQVEATRPPPATDEPGFLSVVDLPPVSRVRQPWTGTASASAMRVNPAATRCDRARFGKAGAVRARWRSFLVPGAKLPTTFGLDESYGRFGSRGAARHFVAGVRRSMAGCEDRDLTATVSPEHRFAAGRTGQNRLEMSVWRFSLDISDQAAITFRVGVARAGSRVAQVTFIPAAQHDISTTQFRQLLRRAGERLVELS